jgi:hypothetical protein
MNRRIIAFAARLYPAAWRKRYGEEFAATLEQMRAPGWAVLWDVGGGALKMQFQYRSQLIRVAAMCGAAGLAVAWGLSLRIPDVYLSESTIQSSTDDLTSLNPAFRRAVERSRLLGLIQKHNLYPAERSRLPLEEVTNKMANDISISNCAGGDKARPAFKVGFAYTDPAIIQRVTDDLATGFARDTAPNSAAQGRFVVLDTASRPDPIYPNRPVAAAMGLCGGALLGAVWAVWKRRRA